MTKIRFVFTVLILMSCLSTLSQAQDNIPWQNLFDGKTLTGWKKFKAQQNMRLRMEQL